MPGLAILQEIVFSVGPQAMQWYPAEGGRSRSVAEVHMVHELQDYVSAKLKKLPLPEGKTFTLSIFWY